VFFNGSASDEAEEIAYKQICKKQIHHKNRHKRQKQRILSIEGIFAELQKLTNTTNR
jgi:hypothetical protein